MFFPQHVCAHAWIDLEGGAPVIDFPSNVCPDLATEPLHHYSHPNVNIIIICDIYVAAPRHFTRQYCSSVASNL